MVLGGLRANRVGEGPAIVVEELTETFRLSQERPLGLKERLSRPGRRSRHVEFTALDGVTFTVAPGESVGVVGPNGSGKSTLLKVLARILPADHGRVDIAGRVASLLELGAGFHGELTGRENVFLNAAILGLTRAEVERRFDDIVEFAGVGAFIDEPLRSYSSGMYVRLGFAIAVHVDPDVLLVDEVLSVGDASFQNRSLERMASFGERGKTVMFVSHDLHALRRLCDRVLVLDRGRLVFDGPTGEGVARYEQLMGTWSGDDATQPVGHSGEVRIVEAVLVGCGEEPVEAVAPSATLALVLRLRAEADVEAVSAGASFHTGDGRKLYEVHTTWQGLGIGPLKAGDVATVEIRFTAHLLAGNYRITPSVTDPSGRTILDVAPEPVRFEVLPSPGGVGLVDLVAATRVVDGPSVPLESAGRDDTHPAART